VPSDSTIDTVKAILLDALGALDAPNPFSDLVRLPLTQPGKVLGFTGRPSWTLTTLAACQAASGDAALGARAAAGIELFMAALDLIDEIEDGDFSPAVEAAGMPQALNAATALLFLGQQTLLQIPSRAGLPDAADFLRVLTASSLTATGGQYLDLASVGGATSATEDALAIARQKAGALSSAACRIGAMVGTADATLLELYGLWGMHFGTAAQLANDLHDATAPNLKSDLQRQKGTLPLTFTRRNAHNVEPHSVSASGALHFTWVVLEIERDACRSIGEQLAERQQDVSALRDLL
jgi:geranylgeranyl pyrophosphate synthase